MDLGIRGVPFFLINGDVPLEGAQPPGVFIETLETVAREPR
jgi:predicted DsbA family dithiol-disulfide isomerase